MYPEIEKIGSLTKVLNSEFVKIDSVLRADDRAANQFSSTFAFVKNEKKYCQIYIVANERLFLPDFWRNGVCLAHGKTTLLNQLAEVIDHWLLKDISTNELSLNFPIVSPHDKAHAFDENNEVEYSWNLYLEDSSNRELRRFIELAMQDEILGKLFPFKSLNALCFSRCTGYPYTIDTPIVIPISSAKNRYEVRSNDQTVIGRGTANDAIKYIKKHLPQNIKPAVKGTAEDL